MKIYVRFFLSALSILGCEYADGHALADSSGIGLSVNSDSAAAADLNKRAYSIVDEFPDSALTFARQAVTTAKKLGLKPLEADCYKTMGAAFDDLGNMDSCLFYLNNALSLFTSIGNKKKSRRMY